MKKILIVDDVAGWIRFHKMNIEYLNLPDIEIETEDSAYNALAKVEVSLDEPYDVIFTDLQMESNFLPKLAGEWLIEQIQMFDEYKNTKIVIISATGNIKQIAEKYDVDYIPKYLVRNSDSEIYRNYII